MAGQGTARHGMARQGKARLYLVVWLLGWSYRWFDSTGEHGMARHGRAWLGAAWRGAAWLYLVVWSPEWLHRGSIPRPARLVMASAELAPA